MLHDANAEGRAQIGNRCAGHKLDRWIVEYLVFALRQAGIGIELLKCGNCLGKRGIKRGQLAAAANHRRGDAHNVGMVQADHSKLDRVFGFPIRICSRGGHLMDDRSGPAVKSESRLGKRRQHAHSSSGL